MSVGLLTCAGGSPKMYMHLGTKYVLNTYCSRESCSPSANPLQLGCRDLHESWRAPAVISLWGAGWTCLNLTRRVWTRRGTKVKRYLAILFKTAKTLPPHLSPSNCTTQPHCQDGRSSQSRIRAPFPPSASRVEKMGDRLARRTRR